jgi:hypothetical protein
LLKLNNTIILTPMLLLTFIQEHNEIPICDDVFKHVLLPFFTIYDLLKIVTTTKQFKKLIQDIISDHPYNLHNAVWEGPKQFEYYPDGNYNDDDDDDDDIYYLSPFILPENPQNYIWVGANLRYVDLHSVNLKNANLRGVDLCCASLTSIDLRYTDLSYANLSCADLRYANLSYANLTYADLENADLSYANLYRANLPRADLTGADLTGADLTSANLAYANLSFADIIGANLHCTDLSYSILENTYTNNFNLSMEYSETFFISKEWD